MPRIKFSFSALDSMRQERALEDGEEITIVAMLHQWVRYTKGNQTPEIRYDKTQPEGFSPSFVLILQDSRVVQMSRFIGQRTLKDRGRISATDSEVEEVRTRNHKLPLTVGAKMRTYFHNCGISSDAFDSADDCIITATVHKRPVENVASTGFKDWYWLTNARLVKVNPVADDAITDRKKQAVNDWATQAHIDIDASEIAWWISALAL